MIPPLRRRLSRPALEVLETRQLLATQTAFSLGATYTQPQGIAGLVVTDLNADGKPDIATISTPDPSSPSSVTVRLGLGGGTFNDPVAYIVGTEAGVLLAADVTGDGVPDLLTANIASSTISLLVNAGDGTFGPARSLAAENNPRAVAVADFNSDGRPDIGIAEQGFGPSGGDLLIYFGDATAASGFVLIGNESPLSGFPTSLLAADVDGNGAPDLVASTGDTGLDNRVDILLNDGGGTLTRSAGPALYGTPNAALVADLNGDTSPDLAYATNAGLELLFGLFNGTFTDDALVTDGAAAGVAAGDFNNDGTRDLVVGTTTAGPSVGLSGSTDQFLAFQAIPGGDAQAFAIADFNGDGALDFIAASANRSTLEIYTSKTTDVTPDLPHTIGGLDPAFGNGSGQIVRTVPTVMLSSIDTAIVQQGELLTAGLDLTGNQVVLTRTFTDGTIDQGFGGRGGLRIPVPDGFTATRLSLDPDNHDLYLFGRSISTNLPAIVRFGSGRDLDSSFGIDGILTVPTLTAADRVDSIAPVKTGFAVGGVINFAGGATAFILQVLSTGALNLHFAKKGRYILGSTPGGLDTVTSMVTDPRGALYATGVASNIPDPAGNVLASLFALKLSSAGKLDRTFGLRTLSSTVYAETAGQKILLQSDGKLVISGDIAFTGVDAAAGRVGSILVRYTAKGGLDPSFNGSGSFVVLDPPVDMTPQGLQASAVFSTVAIVTPTFSDFLSNRAAAASAVEGGRLRQEAATPVSANTILTESQLVADAADLAVSRVTIAGRSPYRQARTISVSLAISDVGTLPITTAQAPVTFYLSADPTLDVSSDLAVGSATLKLGLKAGQSRSAHVSLGLTLAMTTGPFYLFAMTNTGVSGLSELTLDNNVGRSTSPFAIALAPVVMRPATWIESRDDRAWLAGADHTLA